MHVEGNTTTSKQSHSIHKPVLMIVQPTGVIQYKVQGNKKLD